MVAPSHQELLKTCPETDPGERQTEGVTVGILTVKEDDGSAAPSRVQNMAVNMEATIVLQDLPDMPTAVAHLSGLIHALNLKYPKKLRDTFETIQTVFPGLQLISQQGSGPYKTNYFSGKKGRCFREHLSIIEQTELVDFRQDLCLCFCGRLLSCDHMEQHDWKGLVHFILLHSTVRFFPADLVLVTYCGIWGYTSG